MRDYVSFVQDDPRVLGIDPRGELGAGFDHFGRPGRWVARKAHVLDSD